MTPALDLLRHLMLDATLGQSAWVEVGKLAACCILLTPLSLLTRRHRASRPSTWDPDRVLMPPYDMHAFGVGLRVPERLPGLRDGPGPCVSAAVDVELTDPEGVDAGWPRDGAERVVDQRHPDGALFMSVDRHPRAGWRVHAPGHGLHVIAADGAHLTSALPPGPAFAWQKLLFSQVLPLLATAHGFGALHASAISVGGRAFGLLAPSGTGKSSIAMHLVGAGARFLADDVLALRAEDGRVLAEAGTRFANFHPHELEQLDAEAAARLGPRVGASDKLHHEPPGEPPEQPLGGLFFLRRTVEAGSAVTVADQSGDALELLGSGFVAHQQDPRRLLAHLDLCARIRATVPLRTVTMPASSTAAMIAARLLAVIEELS